MMSEDSNQVYDIISFQYLKRIITQICKMNKIGQPILLCVAIFTGSVFLTSGKFLNVTNTPKLYFVVVTLLVVMAITAIHKKRINPSVFLSKTNLWGMYVICFLQACYGLIQFLGWLPSNHSKFAITGSFDNPAGFAAVLSIGSPIGLFLISRAKTVEKYLAIIILMLVSIAIFLSGSRTGMLAIIILSLVFLLLETNIMSKSRQFRNYKLLTFLIIICFLSAASIFYYQKKDSAIGRLLIWKVSLKMIKDKPVFGNGYGAFQAKYMDYQAAYFKNNPNSRYAQLADNVNRPFNEFIKVAVEFGLVGLVVVFSIILFVLWKVIKLENGNRGLVFSGLVSFLVCACFSYPLQYITVWLLLALYLLALLTPKEIKIRNSLVSIIARIVIAVTCVVPLFHVFQQICAEIKWKTIAMSSLRGHTEDILPEYERLYSTSMKKNPFFLYNYSAELNSAGRFDKSIDILTECQQQFNDYDLQMLLADNYYNKGASEKTIQIYQLASNMIPCRFLPLYQIFETYRKAGQKDMAEKYANEIINKKVKIPSMTVCSIKAEAEKYLEELKQVW
jgi:O-antigen ligase